MPCRDGTSGISPLLDLLVESETPLLKKRRVLETLTFLAANSAIAHSICEQGGVALLLQVVAGPNEGIQLEAAETLQALMMHNCAQVTESLPNPTGTLWNSEKKAEAVLCVSLRIAVFVCKLVI